MPEDRHVADDPELRQTGMANPWRPIEGGCMEHVASDTIDPRVMIHELSVNIPGIILNLEEAGRAIDELVAGKRDHASNCPPDHEQGGDLSVAQRSIAVERAFAIMQSILLSNMSSHFLPYKTRPRNYEETDLSSLIGECVDLCKAYYSDIHWLTFHLDGFLPPFITGSDSEIRRAILNLLNNAVKYSYPPRERGMSRYIDVRCAPWHGDGVAIRITSFGVGILPEEMSHILLPYKRGLLARLAQPVGTGIGLSEVSKIARLHRGELVIKSSLETIDVSMDEVARLALEDPRAALQYPWKTTATLRIRGVAHDDRADVQG